MIKRYLIKGMSILLSAMMFASFMPVHAFAQNRPEDNYFDEGTDNEYGDTEKPGDTDKAVKVSATTGDVEVSGGDINGGDTKIAINSAYLSVSAKGHDATVNTGDVTGNEGMAMKVITAQSGEADVTVNGSIKSEKSALTPAAAYIKNSNGKADVVIKGDVEAGKGMSVVWADAYDGGNTEIRVDGDVKGDKGGINTSSHDDSTTNISIGGDITANIGIFGRADTGGSVDIRVEGTVRSDEVGIKVIEEESSTFNVTAWAICPDENGIVALFSDTIAPLGEPQTYAHDEDFEKNNISYIIRVDDNVAGGRLRASSETAHEGDKVLLLVDLENGYEITGAYDDNRILQKYALSKDEDGNYYVVVPKGGGVYLTVTAQKIPNPVIPVVNPVAGDTAENTAGNTDNTIKISTPTVSAEAQAAITVISTTPAGGTVNIVITDSKLEASVVSTLLARRDINVTITSFINGKLCTIMIPAGADLSDLIRPDGTIGLEKLAERFGKTEI